MPVRQLTWSALGAFIVVGAVVWWRAHFRETVQRARDVASVTASELIAAPAESVPDGAVYQRFKARRAAVDSMRLMLRRLAAAESNYWADSTKFTTNLGTALHSIGGVVGPTIQITQDGWWAWVSSTYALMTCKMYVGTRPETTFPNAKPGEPVCTGEHAATYP